MDKLRKLTVALLLLLPTLLMSACGESTSCYKCGKSAQTAYYDIGFSDKYVLCEDCAREYWRPFDYTDYEVGSAKKTGSELGVSESESAKTPPPTVAPTPAPTKTPAPVSTPAPVYTPAPTLKPPVPAASNTYIRSVYASSYLVEDICTHSVDRITDGQTRTAWVEGVDGQGYGEYVSFEFSKTCLVSRISITNGYQIDERRYTANSRPKQLSVYFSNGENVLLDLEDVMGVQTFIFPDPVETEAVVIMIEEVYPGTLCEDTCITDVSFG